VKKLLCVVPALLLLAIIGAPNARGDSYTPVFTCTNCETPFGFPAAAPTAPDVSFPGPTTLNLSIVNNSNSESATFAVTLPTGDGPDDTYTWFYEPFAADSVLPNETLIGITDTTNAQSLTDTFFGDPFHGFGGSGTLTFTAVTAATPEPASILFMLFGAGLIFFMRKRFVMRTLRTA